MPMETWTDRVVAGAAGIVLAYCEWHFRLAPGRVDYLPMVLLILSWVFISTAMSVLLTLRVFRTAAGDGKAVAVAAIVLPGALVICFAVLGDSLTMIPLALSNTLFMTSCLVYLLVITERSRKSGR